MAVSVVVCEVQHGRLRRLLLLLQVLLGVQLRAEVRVRRRQLEGSWCGSVRILVRGRAVG